MSLGPHESSNIRSILDLAVRHNNRLLEQQALASARIQLEAEQELLQRNHLVRAAQRHLQHQQAVSEVFLQSQLNNTHLDDLARLRESQFLQQVARYGESQPVMVYLPTTSLVQPPLQRAVSASQPTDILDLTIDDDDEEEGKEDSGESKKEDSNNTCLAGPSKGPRVVSESAARKRKLHEVSAEANTVRRKSSVEYDATIGARGTMPKPPPIAPLDYVPPKCVQSKDISLLAKVLLGQIDPAETEESSFLKGPILLTPSSLKVLAKRIQGKCNKKHSITKDNEIERLKTQLETVKKKAVSKAEVEQIKKECAREVEEVRRQSQRAMQAYMKATVNAFERLQQTKDDHND